MVVLVAGRVKPQDRVIVSFRQSVEKEAAPHGMVHHRCLRDGLNYLPEENHDLSLFNTCMSCITFPTGREDKQKGGSCKREGAKQEGWLLGEVVTRGTCCTCDCTTAPQVGLFHSPATRKVLLSGVTGRENMR